MLLRGATVKAEFATEGSSLSSRKYTPTNTIHTQKQLNAI
jgi:hypothetical protein